MKKLLLPTIAICIAVLYFLSISSELLATSVARDLIKKRMFIPSSYDEIDSEVVWEGKTGNKHDAYIVKLLYNADNKVGNTSTMCKHLLFWIKDNHTTEFVDKFLMQGCPGNNGTYNENTISTFKSVVFDKY